jgi:hypothetical protein
MHSRFTDVSSYQAVHGNLSLCFCAGRSATAIIRHHDDKVVYTLDLETLEEQEHPAGGFFASVVLMPILVDDLFFMADPEGAQAILDKQFRAEEKCGFFRPK